MRRASRMTPSGGISTSASTTTSETSSAGGPKQGYQVDIRDSSGRQSSAPALNGRVLSRHEPGVVHVAQFQGNPMACSVRRNHGHHRGPSSARRHRRPRSVIRRPGAHVPHSARQRGSKGGRINRSRRHPGRRRQSAYLPRDQLVGRPICHVWTGNYARLLGAHGRVDKSYLLEDVPSTEAFDLARQADGSVIAVGRIITGHTADCDLSSELAAYRLGANGLLDTGFGLNGFFQWANGGDSQARALVLEPDGRIVIAGVGYRAVNGEQQSVLVVLRLLANGEFDATFGNRGVYVGPQVDYLNPIRIVRTSAGEYRVSVNGAGDCAIVGLTSAGGARRRIWRCRRRCRRIPGRYSCLLRIAGTDCQGPPAGRGQRPETGVRVETAREWHA